MRKLLSVFITAILACGLFGADAANDIILSQRKPDNSGNIQRNVPAQNAITSASLPSFQEAIGLGLTDTPNFTGVSYGVTTPGSITGLAGALSLSAAGTNKSITLTPSGTGGVGIGTTGNVTAKITAFGNSVATAPTISTWSSSVVPLMFFTEGDTGGTKDYILATAGTTGQSSNVIFKTSGGTLASPGVISGAQNVGTIGASAYDGGAFRTTASIGFATTSATSGSVAPQRIYFSTGQTTTRSERVDIQPTGSLRIGLTGESAAAWTTSGIISAFQAGTWTDTTSTGSPSMIAFNTFGRPTIAATNVITPSEVASVYIANSPANGTNVTAGNAYSLFIAAGNSKFNGSLLLSGGTIRTQRQILVRTTSGSEATDNSFSVTINEGASAQVQRTLPTAAAGLEYTYIVQDTDGIRVIANTGDTIRIAATVSASAGYIENATIGSTVTLVAINATEWIATAVNGTWTFGP